MQMDEQDRLSILIGDDNATGLTPTKLMSHPLTIRLGKSMARPMLVDAFISLCEKGGEQIVSLPLEDYPKTKMLINSLTFDELRYCESTVPSGKKKKNQTQGTRGHWNKSRW